MLKRIFIFVITTALILFFTNSYSSFTDGISEWIDEIMSRHMDENYELVQFEYSPGYSDMNGETHITTLRRDKDGKWVMISRDRESIAEPMVVTTYNVHPDAVNHFEEFLKEKNVAALSRRSESDLFVTDYSPWSMTIEFGEIVEGGADQKRYRINEYRNYSNRDKKLIKSTIEAFYNLRGEKISEEIEEPT